MIKILRLFLIVGLISLQSCIFETGSKKGSTGATLTPEVIQNLVVHLQETTENQLSALNSIDTAFYSHDELKSQFKSLRSSIEEFNSLLKSNSDSENFAFAEYYAPRQKRLDSIFAIQSELIMFYQSNLLEDTLKTGALGKKSSTFAAAAISPIVSCEEFITYAEKFSLIDGVADDISKGGAALEVLGPGGKSISSIIALMAEAVSFSNMIVNSLPFLIDPNSLTINVAPSAVVDGEGIAFLKGKIKRAAAGEVIGDGAVIGMDKVKSIFDKLGKQKDELKTEFSKATLVESLIRYGIEKAKIELIKEKLNKATSKGVSDFISSYVPEPIVPFRDISVENSFSWVFDGGKPKGETAKIVANYIVSDRAKVDITLYGKTGRSQGCMATIDSKSANPEGGVNGFQILPGMVRIILADPNPLVGTNVILRAEILGVFSLPSG